MNTKPEASITGIHHAQITVPKAAQTQARDFYLGVLGMIEIEKPKSLKGRGGFWAQLGNADLHIGVEDGANRHATNAHIAYQVSDLATWRRRLEIARVAIVDSIPIPGFDRFEFRDPFGNRVEFIQNIVDSGKRPS